MRTTIAPDVDLLLAAEERTGLDHRTAGDAPAQRTRAAPVSSPPTVGDADPIDELVGFAPFPHRGAVISNAVIDQLRESEPE